jgi:hypothetical protein
MASTEMLGQVNWGDGMNCYQPGAAQYAYGENLIIRTGKPETRPGIRRFWKSDAAGLVPSFYFNEENAKYNDPTHTGFWFPWDWVATLWGSLQGFGVIRFPDETTETMLIITQGLVYRVYAGYMKRIPISVEIGLDEVIEVVQAFDKIILFRGPDHQPLGWGGDEGGFVVVPDASVGDDIPWTNRAVLHAGGRLWTVEDRDAVLASDIMEYTEWDRVYQMFSVKPGDGDEIVTIAPFHEDMMLVFKRKSISILSGINSIVDLEAGGHLSDYVTCNVIDTETGLAAPRGFVTVGEDVWYMGAGGNIYSLSRNQQNKVQRQAIALSAPIQSLVSRINPRAVGQTVAGIFGNYVFFAVPLDSSAVNNALLVYDLIAPSQSGVGAWVGLWTSKGEILDVRKFFLFNGHYLYLDGQGVVREPLLDCSSDSDEALADTPKWVAATMYEIGRAVVHGGAMYEAVKASLAIVPGSDEDTWETVADPERYYDIGFALTSPLYLLGSSMTPLKTGRGEVLFSHQWPKIDVAVFGNPNGDRETLFTGIEYDQTTHDVANVDDWVPESDPDGINNAYRADYGAVIGTDGVMLGTPGMYVGRWKMHNLRFIRRLIQDRGFGMTIANTRGRIRIESVAMPVDIRRHATKITV